MRFSDLSEGRDNNYDFLRFVLAGLVIVGHSFTLLNPKGSRVEPLMRVTSGQLDFGGVAVNFFFVISGFLVTNSWIYSRGTLDYLKKRALRIYPGFIAASLVCALVVGPLAVDSVSSYFHGFSPVKFIGRAVSLRTLGIPPIFPNNPEHNPNAPLWTISYEFLCYLGVIALGLVGAYRKRITTLTIFAVMIGLSTLIASGVITIGRAHGVEAFINQLPRLVACFMSGMVFYLYRDRIAYSLPLFVASLAVLLVSSFVKPLLAVSLPVFGSYALFYIAYSRGLKLHHWGRKADLSYGMYLYGYPVQQLVIQYLGPAISPATVFITAFPLACGVAACSWFAVERPFLRLKRKPQAVVQQAPAVPDPVSAQ